MGTRINLCPNPALENNTTGWFGPDGTWDRSIAVSGTLPRSTGYAGTSAGNVVAPRGTVTAGAVYTFSAYVRCVAASSFSVGIDWYSGGSYLSSSSSSSYTQSAGTTVRVSVTGVTAPATATRGLLVINGLDGAAQVTAVLYEQSATLDDYFDGDSTGATWSGTAGNSTSYLLTGSDTVTLTDAGSKAATTPGPHGSDAGAWAEAGSVAASGLATITHTWTDSGLITASGYDDVYGRIRVEARGFPATAIRAVVYSRPASSSTWAKVRGGGVSVVNGIMSRPVDDYEYAAGVPMVYRIDALSNPENTSDVVVASATLTRQADQSGVWLKFISAPWLNRPLRLIDWSPITRKSRNASYDVQGRRDAVVVTDVHSSRSFSITLETLSVAEAEALDEALSSGYPVLFHTPITAPPPTIYAAVGDYSWDRPAHRSLRARFTVKLDEVTPPPASVFASPVTYQTVLDQYPAYSDLLAAVTTYGELL